MLETTSRFAEDDRLIGTLCQPGAMPAPHAGPMVLLPNAGIVHRVGPHRLAVRIARRLARDGISSFRFDVSGVGDARYSRAQQGFEQQSIDDARAAMDFVVAAGGSPRFALFGICSGADLGLRTALADERLERIFLFDPWAYPNARTHRERARMRLRCEGPAHAIGGWLLAKWRRILAAGRNPPAQPAGAGDGRPWQNGRPLPPQDEFEHALRTIDARGVIAHLAYSGSFAHTYSYAEQFDDCHGHLGLSAGISHGFHPGLDHTVTDRQAQEHLINELLRWLRIPARRVS